MNLKLFSHLSFILITLIALASFKPALAEQKYFFSQKRIINDSKYKKAKNYYYNRKFAMARVFLEDLLQEYPEDAEIYTYLGDSLFHLEKFNKAILNYQKANEILPNRGEGKKIKAQNYFQLGKIYFILKKAPSAMAFFELAAMTEPDLIHGFWEKGKTSLLLLRNKKIAIKAWEEYLLLITDSHEKKKIQSAIDILSNPGFKLPPEGSPLSLKKALSLAGLKLTPVKINKMK